MKRPEPKSCPDFDEPRDRRSKDKDEAAAREMGWQAYLAAAMALGERNPGAHREAYMTSLGVYRRELATNALRRHMMAALEDEHRALRRLSHAAGEVGR